MKSEADIKMELNDIIELYKHAIEFGTGDVDYYEGQMVSLEWVLK